LKTYDTSLALFEHPMDYNEIREPAVYIDKTLPDSIAPYFASVPVGYEFGPTPYEILQELFLTQPLEEDDEADSQEDSRFVKAKKSNKASKKIAAYLKSQGIDPYHLEMAAFPNSEIFNAEARSGANKALAKNAPLDMDNIVAWSLPFTKKWRPGGTLKFSDTLKSGNTLTFEQPLVGVRVTAGYSYYWRSSKTDGNGNFSSPERWTFSVYYEAHFDSDRFMLNNVDSWYSAHLKYVKGGTSYQQWTHTFENEHAIWCVIWTAAYNYWYGNIHGLQRPKQDGWWVGIDVYYKNNNGFENSLSCQFQSCKTTLGRYVPLGYIMIQAYDRKNSKPFPHLNIYGTTIHEIAHSSHDYNKAQSVGWFSLSDTLKESYARGVQRYLTIKHYGAWSVSSYDKEYTGIFEDLEDANSTYAKLDGVEKTCDRVSGITVPMAEKSLFKSTSWNGFKDNLMKDYPGGTLNNEGKKVTYTKADMDALFKYWKDGVETPCPEPISDSRDRKVYKTVIIGAQTWMAENLNYNVAGSRCYNDNAANCTTYGRLYDWATAMALPSSCNSTACPSQVNAKHQGICPAGWRIPSVADWDKLMRYADGTNGTGSPYDSPTAGKYLKAASGWRGGDGNSNGEDKYGFSALPGGYGLSDGYFRNVGNNGDWWSTSEYDGASAYRFDLYHGDKAGWEDISGNRKHEKSNLFSIRCIKD